MSGLVKHGESRRQTIRTSLFPETEGPAFDVSSVVNHVDKQMPENESIMNHAESRRQTIHHCCHKIKVTPFDVSGFVKHGKITKTNKTNIVICLVARI